MSIERVGRALWKFRNSRTGFAVLWLLVILFLVKATMDSYADYESLSFSIKWGAVGLAAFFLIIRNVVTPVKWMYMLNVSGSRMTYTETSRAFYLSQLSSLIPGGVWQYLDLGYRASAHGKSLGNVAHAAVYVQGMTVAAGIFYAAVVAAVYLPGYALVSVSAAVTVFAVAMMSPDILERLKGFVRRFGADAGRYRPSRRQLFTLFMISIAIWPVDGALLFFLVSALQAIPTQLFLPVSGVMAASWAAGFLVLVLPGGLGVREGAMIFLLSGLVPAPVAIATAVLARISTLAGKVVMAAFFILVGLESRTDSETTFI